MIAEGLRGSSSVIEVKIGFDSEDGWEFQGISNAVRREITQGLVEGHGMDKGIAVAATSVFYDFETCEGIELLCKNVRCFVC